MPQAPADLPEPAPAHPALAGFERQQREAAAAAAQAGHWHDAAWAWDVVLALRPEDDAALAGRAQALAAAQAGVDARMPRARQALQRGNAEAAQRLFLEVLMLQPGHAEAADGLRRIERDRVQRQHLGQPSRPSMLRRGTREALRVPTPSEARATTAARNEVEHASLLARDGDLVAAIAMLQPLVTTARGGDPVARTLLLDLYLRHADVLAAGDKPAAVATLQRVLQLQPGHPQAIRRLGQLRREIAAARRAPAASVPLADKPARSASPAARPGVAPAPTATERQAPPQR